MPPREPFNTHRRDPAFADAMARAEQEAGAVIEAPATFADSLVHWAYAEMQAGRMTAERYRAVLAERG